MEMVFILLAIFIILMLLRVPIAVSMGLSSLVGFMLIGYLSYKKKWISDDTPRSPARR